MSPPASAESPDQQLEVHTERSKRRFSHFRRISNSGRIKSRPSSTYEIWLENAQQLAHVPGALIDRLGQMAGGQDEGAATTGDVHNSGEASSANMTSQPANQAKEDLPTIKLIPHNDPRSSRLSLSFPPMTRTIPHEDCVIRVGRYSERDILPSAFPNTPSSAPVGFKSKVVSRRHCEFWCSQGQWYIKDVKSSSGTFLNHIRLSQPSVESRPFPVNDGDVVQLGIDFRGGEEMIFRCVKIRIECNRGWQKTLNNYNVSTHKRLRDLGRTRATKDSDSASAHSSECSICLMSIAPCQSLFVAPCSHVWHYRCIRPILNDHKLYPQFLCPNCRAVTDLEAELDDQLDDWEDAHAAIDAVAEEQAAQISSTGAAGEAGLQDSEMGNTQGLGQRSSPSAANSSGTGNGLHNTHSMHEPITADHVPSRTPSLLERRNKPTNEQGGVRVPTGSTSFLRPITPTQPFMSDTDLERTSSATPMDGPPTPTNTAGPFVFDGSAGRASGQQSTTEEQPMAA